MLSMPSQSEMVNFNGSADDGVSQAAAACVIQEAYRTYRHCRLVEVSVFILM